MMTAVHERAVDAAMEVEAKKDSLRQNQDGTWKLVLTIAPDGLPDPIMKAPPGVRYRVFFVEVGDNEEPIKHAPAASDKPKKRFHELPLSQQAALRCQDEGFNAFLEQRSGEEIPLCDTANVVRRICCNVDSRAEFDTDLVAGTRWIAINAEYEQWAGLATEKR